MGATLVGDYCNVCFAKSCIYKTQMVFITAYFFFFYYKLFFHFKSQRKNTVVAQLLV